MLSTDGLREALQWVGDGMHQSVRLVFEHGGTVDAHYQVNHVYEHTAFGLSERRIERLQEVHERHDLWVEDSGDDEAGEFLTLHGVGEDVDANVEVALAILREVYGVDLDDVERVERETGDPEYYRRESRDPPGR